MIIKVETLREAWEKVDKIFPYDYEKDENSSNRAGYDIYRCRLRNHETNYYNYICDLGNRLEINLTNQDWKSETYNILIEDIKGKVLEELRNNTERFYGLV